MAFNIISAPSSGAGGVVSADWPDITNKPSTFPPSAHTQAISTITGLQTELDNLNTGLGTKQDTLISGTNIKTINGNSLLGSGNIVISGGGGGLADGDYTDVTVSGTGAVITINNGVVGTAKLGGDITTAGKALLDDADTAAQRTTLGLVIGTNVQAFSAKLDAIHSLAWAANKGLVFTGAGAVSSFDLSTFVQGILGSADQAAFRTAIGISAVSVNASTLYGRGSAGGAGALESITLSGLSMAGTVLSPDFAVASDINTGTSATKVLNPDSFAGSNFGIRFLGFELYNNSTDVAVATKLGQFTVPAAFAGFNIVYAVASVDKDNKGSGSGTTSIQLTRRRAGADVTVFSTQLTIDPTEETSTTAAAAYVINTANDDLAAGDVLVPSVTAVPGTTVPKGLFLTIGIQLP